MNKTIKVRTVLLLLPLFIAAVIGAYYFGAQPKGQIISAETYFNDRNAAQEKYNRLANDYESACYNYQALYEAYDQLYKKVGFNAGMEKHARVDGARGNEGSCYR